MSPVNLLETHAEYKHNIKRKNIEITLMASYKIKLVTSFSMGSKWDFCGFALFIVNFILKVLNKELGNLIDKTHSVCNHNGIRIKFNI